MFKCLRNTAFFTAVAFFSAPALASTRDEVAKALRDHLIDRTFITENASSSRDASGEVSRLDLTRRWTFANLALSDKGLSFNAIVNIAQTNTFTAVDGTKTVRRRDRAMLVRFEAQELKTNGALVGFAHYVSYAGMDGKDPTGRALTFSMKLVGDQLRMTYNDIAPAESASGADGTLRLVQCDHQDDFKLAGLQSTRKFFQQCYAVDPATMTRGEALDPYLSEDEIESARR
jgi:hypothetical protein